MTTEPGPGFDGSVRLTVLELDAPRRMVWRWCGGPLDTTLTFRLEPRVVFAREGTRLYLEHAGFDALPAVLVSFILGAGWARMLRLRLPAVLADHAAVACEVPERGSWYVIARLLGPILRRLQR
jgi:hypothetical protein